MRGLKSLLASPVFLAIGILSLAGATLAVLIPGSRHIMGESVSTTSNFYTVGAVMALLALLALLESVLAVRIVWGRGAIVGEERRPGREEADEDADRVRSMRVTGTKKAVVFGALLAANIMLFDQIGGGVLVTETRRYHVLTQLRAPGAADRRTAARDAIQLMGDKEVAAALGKVMSEEGAGREWAAHAAGVRHDESLKDALAGLMRSGEGIERGAAAVALARMNDPRLLRLVIDAFPHAEDRRRDLLIAVGMLGKVEGVTGETDLEECGGYLADLLEGGTLDEDETRLAIWALGRIESPAGLPGIKSLLSPATDTATLCIALEALGRIGEAASSDDMIAIVDKVDRRARCPETVAADFSGHEVLLSGGLDLVERILREIANIGDDQVKERLEKISKDKTHTEQVRKMAEEIAFQMRYKPVTAR